MGREDGTMGRRGQMALAVLIPLAEVAALSFLALLVA